jgi:hypothetical protein
MHHTGTSDSLSSEEFKPHRKDCRKKYKDDVKGWNRMKPKSTKIYV